MTSLEIDLLINAAQGANSLKDVRAKLKEIKSAMLEVGEDSAEFNRLAQAAAQLGDRVDDVNQRLKAFNPDGFAALTNFAGKAAGAVSAVTGAMALFGDQSEDVQKALMKVQAALALGQGIDAVKGLGAAFKDLWSVVLANPLAAVTAALAALAIGALAVYDAMFATSEATKQLNAEYEKQQKITTQLVADKQNEIALLEAQGASEEDIIAAKKDLIKVQITELDLAIQRHKSMLQDIDDHDSLWESIVRASGAVAEYTGNQKIADNADAVIAQNKRERAEAEQQALVDDQIALDKLKNDLLVLDAERDTKAREAFKLNLDKRVKDAEDAASKQEKINQDLWDATLKQIEAGEAAADAASEAAKAAAEKNAEDWEKALQEVNDFQQAAYEDENKRAEAAKKRDEMVAAARLQAVSNLFSSLSQLAGKNAKLNKAFAVGEATVNTYKGVTAALAQPLPTPINFINAAAVLAAGIKSVQNILKADTSGGGSSSLSTGSLGAFGGVSALNNEPAQPQQPTTPMNPNGDPTSQNTQNQPFVVYASWTEGRDVGRRVESAESAMEFR